jgi:uncharacterized membrane-anchored protein
LVFLRAFSISAFVVLAFCSTANAELFKDAFPKIFAQLDQKYQADVGKLELQHGTVVLEGGIAKVDVPEGYYFLGPKDAQYVIETLWDNPKGAKFLGMVFPSTMTPFEDESWAITYEYDPIGYVSDADAEGYNYAELLAQMQADTKEENAGRVKDGYSEIESLGWATEPHYDKAERKLHWAKRLSFSDYDGETLNYNIRALGRKGVLIVNFIAGMDQLADVEAAVPAVLKMTSFTDGNKYTDFLPNVDTVAAVGIGGLIAGKVAAKAGLIILLLAFLKKGFVLVLLPLIWLKKKLFGKSADS